MQTPCAWPFPPCCGWANRQGTARLVTRPRRCQEPPPGWKHPLAGVVFASFVYTQDSWGSAAGSAREGSAEWAPWCCLSSRPHRPLPCPDPSSFQAPPTCLSVSLTASVDQALSRAWHCAQSSAFRQAPTDPSLRLPVLLILIPTLCRRKRLRIKSCWGTHS